MDCGVGGCIGDGFSLRTCLFLLLCMGELLVGGFVDARGGDVAPCVPRIRPVFRIGTKCEGKPMRA